MDISKSQVEAAVKGLLIQDKYKNLSSSIGGWFWATEGIHAVLANFPSESAGTLKSLILATLSVSAQFADIARDFVDDLFDVFAILMSDASAIVGGAVAGGNVAALAVTLSIAGPLAALQARAPDSGRGTDPYGATVAIATAVVLGTITLGAGGALATGAAIVGESVVGGAIAASERGTAGKVAGSAKSSRTATRFFGSR